jgi:hypothetical protein
MTAVANQSQAAAAAGEMRVPGMTRGVTLLFAVAGAVAVWNLYWAQPLLAKIAGAFAVSLAATGTLITVTQLGYALGVLLLVPLGDSLNRRRFIPLGMGASAVALSLTAFAPSYTALLCGLAAVGLTSLAGQLLVPLAGDLARDDQRAIVKHFAREGARIVMADISDESGEEAAALKERAIYVHNDVLEEVSIAAAARDAVEHFGRFDIMCNNAGSAGDTSAITELGEKGFETTFELNAHSALLGHEYAAGQFRHH